MVHPADGEVRPGEWTKWLWSDGSYSGIAKTITDGVMQPKEYRSPMPPMGGAHWTAEPAAYVQGHH